jgi:hypothetical protein
MAPGGLLVARPLTNPPTPPGLAAAATMFFPKQLGGVDASADAIAGKLAAMTTDVAAVASPTLILIELPSLLVQGPARQARVCVVM